MTEQIIKRVSFQGAEIKKKEIYDEHAPIFNFGGGIVYESDNPPECEMADLTRRLCKNEKSGKTYLGTRYEALLLVFNSDDEIIPFTDVPENIMREIVSCTINKAVKGNVCSKLIDVKYALNGVDYEDIEDICTKYLANQYSEEETPYVITALFDSERLTVMADKYIKDAKEKGN